MHSKHLALILVGSLISLTAMAAEDQVAKEYTTPPPPTEELSTNDIPMLPPIPPPTKPAASTDEQTETSVNDASTNPAGL